MNVATFPRRDEAPILANVEAEAALLGAALIDNAILDFAGERLGPADFVEPLHREIFEQAIRCRAMGTTVSPVTLAPRFKANEALKELGGPAYLARLTADGQGLLAPRELIEQILELAARRKRREWFLAEIAATADLNQPLGELTPPSEIGATRPLEPLDLAAMAGRDPKPKVFTIPKIAPSAEVTLFTGPGAVGKSLLAQQLCTAMAAGRRTLGLDLNRSPTIYLTCEDDAEQLHWRAVHVCKSLGLDLADLAGALHLLSLRGEPENALAHFAGDGRIVPAPLFGRLSALIAQTGARLVALDNVAHLFTGNENDRGQVTQFVNLLNRLAGKTGAAILLLGHPNKAGASYSGSTAWMNAVRSQASMGRPDGDDADPDARTVTVGKPNYMRAGETIRFRWREWAFVLDEDVPADQRAQLCETIRASGDNALFLACLTERTRQRRAVSERRSATFAPTVFATMPESKGIGAKRLEAAMDRLFRLGAIERQALWRGADRKLVHGLRETAGDGAGNTVQETRETLL